MLEMKEPATEWSSESFRLFLYKFSSSSFSLDSSAFSDLKLPTPSSQTTAAGQASPHSRRYCSVFGNLANFENLPKKLMVTGGERAAKKPTVRSSKDRRARRRSRKNNQERVTN